MHIPNMPFSFFSPGAIHYGRGQSQQAADLAKGFGTSVLLVHGATAARAGWLVAACAQAGLKTTTLSCAQEPSLPDLEAALADLKGRSPDVVIALGSGAVIDFAKALAALIRCDAPPIDYLEVVGTGRALDHAPLPMIALPTTAGTGAEVTKNAVISVPSRGLKVSLRDPRMIPNIAIIDPALMQGAPKKIALAAGLDAITQLIEPFLSTKANPMTDALCRQGLDVGFAALRRVVEADDPAAWDVMGLVSLYGGLALANAGLGAVHGLAGVIGGTTNAPHGEICGALLPAVLASHNSKLAADRDSETALRLDWVLGLLDRHFASDMPDEGGQTHKGKGLPGLLRWSKAQGLRGLGEMGLKPGDYAEVAAAGMGASSMKANPFVLTQQELVEIMQMAE
jgi:alcohol dehydrogenase class IV